MSLTRGIIVDSYSLCSTCGFSISLCSKVLLHNKNRRGALPSSGTGYNPQPSNRKYLVLNVTDLCCSDSQLSRPSSRDCIRQGLCFVFSPYNAVHAAGGCPERVGAEDCWRRGRKRRIQLSVWEWLPCLLSQYKPVGAHTSYTKQPGWVCQHT